MSFGILALVFTCAIRQSATQVLQVPLALIRPLNIVTGLRTRKDKHLSLYRVRAVNNRASQIISVRSIVRGAYLIADVERCGDFFAVDSTDTDMFLRLNRIFRPETWEVA